jgi:hypothetical protein
MEFNSQNSEPFFLLILFSTQQWFIVPVPNPTRYYLIRETGSNINNKRRSGISVQLIHTTL